VIRRRRHARTLGVTKAKRPFREERVMTDEKTPSVLIVEDERIVAKDLQQTLTDLGYDAFAIASSTDEAIARATERCPMSS